MTADARPEWRDAERERKKAELSRAREALDLHRDALKEALALVQAIKNSGAWTDPTENEMRTEALAEAECERAEAVLSYTMARRMVAKMEAELGQLARKGKVRP